MRVIFVDKPDALDTRYLDGKEVLVGRIASTLTNKPMTRVVLITASRKTVRVNVFTDNQGRFKLKEGNILYLEKDTGDVKIVDGERDSEFKDYTGEDAGALIKVEIESLVVDIVTARRLLNAITPLSHKTERIYSKDNELKFVALCREDQYTDLTDEFFGDETVVIRKTE